MKRLWLKEPPHEGFFVCGDVMEITTLIHIAPLNIHRLFNLNSQPKTSFRGCSLQMKGTLTLLGNFCVISFMKRLWLILFVVLLFAQDPCSSKEFLRLKNVNINNMTEREYQYFMMISEKCTDKGKVTKSKPANNNEYPHFNSPSKTTNFNRRKITIKTDRKTYGGGISVEVIDGVYIGGIQSKLETRWVAHEGFNPIIVG